jgi:hypothetical protein
MYEMESITRDMSFADQFPNKGVKKWKSRSMRSGIKITKQIKHTHKVRGRPPEDGSLDGGLMRLSNDLKDIIESEKQEGERLNDTVLRLVREGNFAK